MIKAKVTLTGTISRNAQQRYDRENKPVLSFWMKMGVPSNNGEKAEIEMYVTPAPSAAFSAETFIPTYIAGRRVTVKGVLDIYPITEGRVPERGKAAEPAFTLTAEEITGDNVPAQDSLTGELEFSGSVNKNIDVKKTKRGSDFLIFSAASMTKDRNDNFFAIYVRFLRFLAEGEAPDALRPAWLQPKTKIIVHGDLQLQSYNGRLSFSSRVKDMQEKPPYNGRR